MSVLEGSLGGGREAQFGLRASPPPQLLAPQNVSHPVLTKTNSFVLRTEKGGRHTNCCPLKSLFGGKNPGRVVPRVSRIFFGGWGVAGILKKTHTQSSCWGSRHKQFLSYHPLVPAVNFTCRQLKLRSPFFAQARGFQRGRGRHLKGIN